MRTKSSHINFSGAKSVLAAVGIAAALTAAGCGNDDQADAGNGKQLFVENCGSCHVLADANSKGVTGPNLDDAFAQSRRDGMNDATIESVTLTQIRQPSQKVPSGVKMPANILTGAKARDVAAYVGSVAGLESTGEGASGATGASGE